MLRPSLKASAAAIGLLAATSAFAAPPAGVPHGPPAGIPMGPPAGIPHGPPAGIPHGPPQGIPSGPPAAATSHIPEGVATGKPDGASASAHANVHASAAVGADANGDPSLGKGASLLGKLNAAHASENGLAHASSKSVVGALGIYKSTTQTAQADVANYTQAVANDNANITADQSAVNDAQATLDAAKNASPVDQKAVDDAQAALDAANAQLTADQNQLTADQASLDAANQSILDAQTALEASTNTTLSPEVVTKLNALLGL